MQPRLTRKHILVVCACAGVALGARALDARATAPDPADIGARASASDPGDLDARATAPDPADLDARATAPDFVDFAAAAPLRSGTVARATGPDPRDDRELATAAALKALTSHVTRSSHHDALRTAFRAYFSYRLANPERVKKPFLYFVDLGLDNATPRGYVFDMDDLTLVEGPFTVAHGRGSSRQRNAVPTTFSNRPGSYSSSLGLYLAEETYAFSGSGGGGRYTSIGMRMSGESGAFNDAARARGIVAHGAPYVTARDAGRSEGCPAMEQQRARRLLPLLADGGVVFIYSPNDVRWLAEDPWVNDN